MTTLAEFMIIAGADNRPPMLENPCMTRGRVLLKRMALLGQRGLAPDVYAIVNHHKVNKEICDRVKLLMQGTELSPFKTAWLLYNKFKGGKDKVMLVLAIRVMLLVLEEIMHEGKQGWLNVIIVKVKVTWLGNALSQRGLRMLHGLRKRQYEVVGTLVGMIEDSKLVELWSPFKTAWLLYNKFKGGKDKVMLVLAIRVMLLVLEEIMHEGKQGWLNVIIVKVKVTWLGNALSQRGLRMLHGLRKRQYVISEVPHFEPYHTNMDNHSVHAMHDSFRDNLNALEVPEYFENNDLKAQLQAKDTTIELTLRVGKEAITFNLDQILRYSANYNDMMANRINVIDMACEEYSQEVLGFYDVITSGNPSPYYDPIVSTSSLTLTPFGDSDFLLEEVDAFLALEDDPTSSKPPEVELKDLPPHLEYAFLEGDDKLPVIIAKNLSDEEKTALIKVSKSHKQAIAWKLSKIKGINSEFCTHKILMEDDFEPVVQHQRRVSLKIHDVIKK
nr:reverse transcriptase domain-containing protein [Tanacetum cinerariifolium]